MMVRPPTRRYRTGIPPSTRGSRPRAHPRRGSLLIELTVATAMLMIGMSLAVKVLGYAALQRRAAEQRQRAVQEVANVMERITADPFDEVTTARAKAISISPSTASSLPGAELAVEVTPSQPDPGRLARRIAVRLRWRNRAGEWEAPVRLTTWIERGRPAP
jgi:Tfp pilus assembly protein PilV